MRSVVPSRFKTTIWPSSHSVAEMVWSGVVVAALAGVVIVGVTPAMSAARRSHGKERFIPACPITASPLDVLKECRTRFECNDPRTRSPALSGHARRAVRSRLFSQGYHEHDGEIGLPHQDHPLGPPRQEGSAVSTRCCCRGNGPAAPSWAQWVLSKPRNPAAFANHLLTKALLPP